MAGRRVQGKGGGGGGVGGLGWERTDCVGMKFSILAAKESVLDLLHQHGVSIPEARASFETTDARLPTRHVPVSILATECLARTWPSFKESSHQLMTGTSLEALATFC